MRDFESSDDALELRGAVTSGDRKARNYLSMPGYTEQFVERLGYEPFPGTLNLELTEESVSTRSKLDELDPILIQEWSDDDRTYGAVLCYPAEIGDEADGALFTPCHLIVPKRTDHEDKIIEVIAPENLRDVLGVSDQDALVVNVWSA